MSEHNPFAAVVVGIPLQDGFLTDKGDGAEGVWTAVLNIGAKDGVEIGQTFVIFKLGPELFDPITTRSLGHYEIVRGNAKVSHIQDSMCTVVSARTKYQPSAFSGLLAGVRPKDEPGFSQMPAPFDLIEVGDFARRV